MHIKLSAPRFGESRRPPERNDRYFRMDRNWYFHTREGRDLGPFHNLPEAERAANNYLASSASGGWI